MLQLFLSHGSAAQNLFLQKKDKTKVHLDTTFNYQISSKLRLCRNRFYMRLRRKIETTKLQIDTIIFLSTHKVSNLYVSFQVKRTKKYERFYRNFIEISPSYRTDSSKMHPAGFCTIGSCNNTSVRKMGSARTNIIQSFHFYAF